MNEDFFLIDFAVSTRSPLEIAEALQRAVSRGAFSDKAENAGGGMFRRMFHSGPNSLGSGSAVVGWSVQATGSLPEQIVHIYPKDLSGTGLSTPLRISGPHGSTGVTLLEFRGAERPGAPLCEAISGELAGEELFCFRYSGLRHPGAHYAFDVYRDGRIIRNAASVSANGTTPESAWEGTDSGMPHPFETDSLPAPAVPKSQIMTPDRLASILRAIGVEPASLFHRQSNNVTVLELDANSTGKPLSSVSASTMDEPPNQPSEAKENNAVQVPANAAPGTAAPRAAANLAPWEMQKPAPSWEDEVTGLLLLAAQTGIAPQNQVSWLSELTSRLEAGEIDSAMTIVVEVIRNGSLEDPEKQSAISRLADLFGRTQ